MSVSQDLVNLLGLAAIAVLLWNGCDRTREADSPGGTAAMPTLHSFTWSDYVSPELIHEFEQAHGARVVVDTFSSNKELLAKLQGGASGYDVTVPSDFMVSIMAAQGMLADLDRNALPNLKALEPHLQHPAFDPTHRYAVPYIWGTVGIGYDSAVVTPPPDSWDILWDTRFRGRISMLNDCPPATLVCNRTLSCAGAV